MKVLYSLEREARGFAFGIQWQTSTIRRGDFMHSVKGMEIYSEGHPAISSYRVWLRGRRGDMDSRIYYPSISKSSAMKACRALQSFNTEVG